MNNDIEWVIGWVKGGKNGKKSQPQGPNNERIGSKADRAKFIEEQMGIYQGMTIMI